MTLARRTSDKCRISCTFITIFFIAAVLNLALSTDVAAGEDSNSYESDDIDNQLTSESSDSSDSSTAVPPYCGISAKSSTGHSSIFDPHEPYMAGLTSPLAEEDLEQYLDFYNEGALMREYDFDSMHLMKKLVDSAIRYGTPPNRFREEIQDLITLQNRSRAEQEAGVTFNDLSLIPPASINESLLKRMTIGFENEELKRLEKKYNVSSHCASPESITAMRLALMFPHYLNFGQKPLATPSNISIGLKSNKLVPSIFGRREFGGTIPLSILTEPDGRAVLGVHLYALHRNDLNDVIPFRTKLVMLRKRMRKSILSDERRLRFLVNNDVIRANGTLLRTSVRDAFNAIPSGFKDRIDWNLLAL